MRAAIALALLVIVLCFLLKTRAETKPILIDAAYPAGGAWCDVPIVPFAPPRVAKPIDPVNRIRPDTRNWS